MIELFKDDLNNDPSSQMLLKLVNFIVRSLEEIIINFKSNALVPYLCVLEDLMDDRENHRLP